MSLSISKSQLAKDGIHVTYSDNSTQNITFADKKLTVDSGLVVSSGGLNASGAVQMNGTLGVSGAATLTNNLAVGGTITSTGHITAQANIDVGGDHRVHGSTYLMNPVVVSSTTNQQGAVTMGSTLNVTGEAHVTSNLWADSNLEVAQDAHIHNRAIVYQYLNARSVSVLQGAVTAGSTLDVAGATTLGNALTVSGASTLNNGVTVNGTSTHNGAMAVSGAATVGGSLTTTGAANLNSTLNVTGASHLSNTLQVDGVATVGNNLGVNGYTNITKSTAGVAGNLLTMNNPSTGSMYIDLNSNSGAGRAFIGMEASNGDGLFGAGEAYGFDIGTASNTSLNFFTNNGSRMKITAGGNLEVSGAASLANNLAVAGTATVTGAASLNNTLAVTGATTLNNTLGVTGAASLNSTLAVTGPATLNNTLAVTGASSLNNTLAVTGAATLGNTLAVTGAATFQNNVTVNGNLTVLGNQTAIDTTSLQVKDAAILIADGNTADIVPSGIQIQYKPTGASDVKYAGVKRVPETGEFVFFKDSSKTIDDPSNSLAGTPILVSPGVSGLVSNTWTKNGVNYTASSSSTLNANYAPYGAFNSSGYSSQAVFSACSANGQYTGSQGAYSGSLTTTVDSIGAVGGEWIQLQMSSPMAMASYSFSCGSFNNLPRVYYIVGSNNGTTWYPVQYAEMASNPLQYDYTSMGSSIKLDQSGVQTVQSNETGYASGSGSFTKYSSTATAYSYYRVIATAVWGNNPFELNEWSINFVTRTTETLPTTYTIEWRSIENNTFPINQAISTSLSNVNPKTMHRSQGYNLPAGTYSYSATARNDSNEYNNIKLYDEFGNQLVNFTGTGVIYPWTNNGPYTGSFTLNDPTMIYCTMPPGEYYMYNTLVHLNLTQTSAPAVQVAAGDVYATVMANSFNCASDARLKKDVTVLDGALATLDSIRGVRYNWIDNSVSNERQVGVIAQEIQAVYPELVRQGGNGFLSVDYPKLTAVLIQSVKELKAMVIALANK
jgi:Chaperone of endosialidase